MTGGWFDVDALVDFGKLRRGGSGCWGHAGLLAPECAQLGPVTAPAPVPPAALAPTVEVPRSDAQIKLSFSPVVKAASPSVVNVYATRIEQQTVSPFANDPFFSRFFGRNQFQSRPRESQSLGSGVIVDAGGVILTNRHVIEGATDVRIALSDGREFAVDIVIEDAQTDLAVLRVRQPGDAVFPAIVFANS
ncbi:S1C family serine protease [Devosia sp. A8/3-2]|nr:S1C family serine protease [Devosia sp. A8/3-2]